MEVYFYAKGIARQHVDVISEQEFVSLGGATMYLKTRFNSARSKDFAEYCGVFEENDGTTVVIVFDTVAHANDWIKANADAFSLLLDNQ